MLITFFVHFEILGISESVAMYITLPQVYKPVFVLLCLRDVVANVAVICLKQRLVQPWLASNPFLSQDNLEFLFLLPPLPVMGLQE